MEYTWDFNSVYVYRQALYMGLAGTLRIFVICLVCGLSLGLAVGLARYSRRRALRCHLRLALRPRRGRRLRLALLLQLPLPLLLLPEPLPLRRLALAPLRLQHLLAGRLRFRGFFRGLGLRGGLLGELLVFVVFVGLVCGV